MTYADFITRHPEFAAADASQVNAALEDALLELDPAVWRAKLDIGQEYLAAHKLALSPFGQGVRLVAKDGTTTYQKHYDRLKLQVTSGFRVC